jgi:hypothetical protein
LTSKQSFHYAPELSKPLIGKLIYHDCGIFDINLWSPITYIQGQFLSTWEKLTPMVKFSKLSLSCNDIFAQSLVIF